VCGRAAQFWGDERQRGLRSPDEADAEADQIRAVRELPRAEGEIAERRLCPDGDCTGVIGDDRHCRVCGMFDVRAPVRAGADGAGADGADDGEDEDVDGDPGDADASAGGDADDDDDRQLCPDGGCTGLIGDDGTCRVCGRRAEG
jgi:hypothetical protein